MELDDQALKLSPNTARGRAILVIAGDRQSSTIVVSAPDEEYEQILSLVSTAYNTLSDVVKKERYDELLGSDSVGLGQKGDDRFQAQVQSQSGKVYRSEYSVRHEPENLLSPLRVHLDPMQTYVVCGSFQPVDWFDP